MGIENYSRRVHQEQPNLNPYSPILENLGRTVSGKELILSVVDNVIAPFVKMYMSKQTVAGKTLGKEDHSGSTSKHFYNHLLGKGSLLKQRYEYWKRRLEQEGKNSTNEKIIEKFMADGKIAAAEMLSR